MGSLDRDAWVVDYESRFGNWGGPDRGPGSRPGRLLSGVPPGDLRTPRRRPVRPRHLGDFDGCQGAGAAKERKNASLDFIGDPVAGPNSRPPSLGLVRLEYGTGLPRMRHAGHIQLGGWRAFGIDRLVGVG